MSAIDLSQTYADVVDASRWPDALPRPGNQRLKRLSSAVPWFEVYEVAPATFAILEPHHYEEVISYLIAGEDRAVLLDTGMGIGDIRAEADRLAECPIIVVNSHSHYDHVGGNHRFPDVWAFDDSVEIGRIEAGIAPADAAQYVLPDTCRGAPPGFDPSAFRIRPSPVTKRLRDLDEIGLGSRTLTVYHTPGHSPGSICLLDSRTGILFTGDTLYPGTLYAHFAESNFIAYRRSLRRLAGLLDEVSHLCPAHNEARVAKHLLVSVRKGFDSIATGEAAFHAHGDVRIYTFEGYRITLSSNV